MSIATIVLAAGGSTRLGRPKQLVRFRGVTLLRRAVDAAVNSQSDRTVVVLGADADRIRGELEGLEVSVVMNSHWMEGIASSIRAGVESLPASVEGVLLTLCDQPQVSPGHLNAIIRRFVDDRKLIVASGYGGTAGVPALFPRWLFPELISLKGDRGAKQIIERHGADTDVIPFPGGTIDIDTHDDLERIDR